MPKIRRQECGEGARVVGGVVLFLCGAMDGTLFDLAIQIEPEIEWGGF